LHTGELALEEAVDMPKEYMVMKLLVRGGTERTSECPRRLLASYIGTREKF
jgi:hypothetical protein